METRLTELTETSILQRIRENFDGESLTGIDTEALIRSSVTLEELFLKLRTALEFRNSGNTQS